VTVPAAVLHELWRSVEHVARARLAVLDGALQALLDAAPDAAQRAAAAHEECHKLVGSLDSYGRTGGSALALQVAGHFAEAHPDTTVLADVLQQLRRTVDGAT
jgi:hypothetical protein